MTLEDQLALVQAYRFATNAGDPKDIGEWLMAMNLVVDECWPRDWWKNSHDLESITFHGIPVVRCRRCGMIG